MKDELIQQLRLLGMGRVNAAYAIADILMPAPVDLAQVKEDCLAAAEVLRAETVDIEVEPEAPPPDPAPAKPKRKKA